VYLWHFSAVAGCTSNIKIKKRFDLSFNGVRMLDTDVRFARVDTWTNPQECVGMLNKSQRLQGFFCFSWAKFAEVREV
jgi:hypothetical protein